MKFVGVFGRNAGILCPPQNECGHGYLFNNIHRRAVVAHGGVVGEGLTIAGAQE